MPKTIGVLALQGDFREHINKIEKAGFTATEVRRSAELASIDALIIPGGESTTIAKLEDAAANFTRAEADKLPIFDAIKKFVIGGLPVWGTCMGSIVLAKDIEGSKQGRIGLMDISVKRNAFGPQRASSEVLLDIPVLGETPFPGIFIRAPLFTKAGSEVEVLCEYSGGFVMARENNMLATAFHPEITQDSRVHEYFFKMI
ncbi:MAG TPA: pyridoxal 5'-phosphate synthase glutaminase subunit PdxT [Candidatus Kapabacteria bacterium]|nr:pyridoxal 5'-phosphate synthase glutaminase subunit PdxT [Candidatus Kapabacteria bacterium]